MNKLLPLWLIHELTHPPSFERHRWLLVMALKILNYRTEAEMRTLMAGAVKYVSRPVPQREFDATMAKAVQIHREREQERTLLRQWQDNSQTPAPIEAMGAMGVFPTSSILSVAPAPKWPARQFNEIDRVVRGGPQHEEGTEMSPVKFDPARRHTEEVIDMMFPGNPLLCVAQRGNWEFWTKPREHFRKRLWLCSQIVPSPMSAPWGLTQEGEKSAHSLNNVGPRHYLVTEFDFTKLDEEGNPTLWAPLIEGWEAAGISVRDARMALSLHLAKSAPLVLINYSGGKSDHAWFDARGRDEAKLFRWMQYAVSMGACSSTWSRSQFVRMPDGTRWPSLRRQSILYFNPQILTSPSVST
jgi:hypothetical protein